ncbi:MAG: hypothetical protein HKN20_11470, partial [Gemmatimonadetes bacterium]|nr:hypothetical protein [Gemmatimonadota bacterium]
KENVFTKIDSAVIA